MSADLQNPIFHDETKAREALEATLWPDGPVCPHCGNVDSNTIGKIEGKKHSHRPGLYYCGACKKQFTVTVGTVFERSKIPLSKWWLAVHLISSSKKGISAHQLWRMLGFGSYRTAWFMAHRIREAMKDMNPGAFGGGNKVVEADETYVGGKARNRAYAPPPKKVAVFALVERDGKVRSRHVADVTADTLREAIEKVADAESHLMTDEAATYLGIGKEFAGHSTVNHSKDEYVRLGGFVHTNTIENYFSILKRGVNGVYHHVSEAHLHRYLAEFDFRYSNRSGLGIEDAQRTKLAMKGAAGKRLTYRRPDEAAHA
jgi:transposase-like protein